MRLLLFLLGLALGGCSTRVDGLAPSYLAGQNFGEDGSTICRDANGNPTRQTTHGYVPWCSVPDDGDPLWDSRNRK